MNCPYINPTIQQCENCQLDDCYSDYDLTVDEYELANAIDGEIKDCNSTNAQRNWRKWRNNHLSEESNRNHQNYINNKYNPHRIEQTRAANRRYKERKKAERMS